MSIEKFEPTISHEENPYTVISTEVIQNITDGLALAVYCYLMSKPKNWQIIKSHVKTHFNIGDKKLKQIFAYFGRVNLIENLQSRLCNGKMGKHEIRILNGSKFNASAGGSKTAIAVDRPSGEEGTTNNRDYKEKRTNKKQSAKTMKQPVDNFEHTHEELQEAIARDIDLPKCFKKFRKFHPGKFKRIIWERWFAKEKNGKKAINRHLDKQMREHQERKAQEMRQS
jgi:hypothetical protein